MKGEIDSDMCQLNIFLGEFCWEFGHVSALLKYWRICSGKEAFPFKPIKIWPFFTSIPTKQFKSQFSQPVKWQNNLIIHIKIKHSFRYERLSVNSPSSNGLNLDFPKIRNSLHNENHTAQKKEWREMIFLCSSKSNEKTTHETNEKKKKPRQIIIKLLSNQRFFCKINSLHWQRDTQLLWNIIIFCRFYFFKQCKRIEVEKLNDIRFSYI